MKPLSVIYWIRACLGIVAAVICVVIGLFIEMFNNIFNGVSLAILVYIITNYILRQLFIAKVEKASKVITTGIGAYFLIWVVTWILLYSLTHPGG